MTKPKIFVVDDDPVVRDSLRVLIESAGFEVDDFESAKSFLDSIDDDTIGCLVTDIRMPGMDGLALQEEISEQRMLIPVIVITGHGDVSLAVRAMKAGALDFVEKPFDDEVLLASIERGLDLAMKAQESALSVEVATERLALLTEREREVFDQLIIGHANKVIAHELKISPRTVEVHRGRVMEKLGARNLSDLIRAALSAGLDIGLD